MDYDKKLEQARIPKRYWDITIDTYLEHGGDEEAASDVTEYMAELANQRSAGRGLLLWGKPGLGKTLLASIVLKFAAQEGFSGVYLTFPHLINLHHKMRDLKDAWFTMKDQEAYNEWVRRGAALDDLRSGIDFVLIDDVGKEHKTNTGYAEDVFEEIFRVRFDNGLPTLLTSNLAPDQWAGEYSEAMADFVHEACGVIEVGGRSFRSS